MLDNSKDKFVVGIGDLVVDIVTNIQDFPIQGNKFYFSSDINFNVGGRCNFLIALSRLNIKAAAIDVIGNDKWGDYLCEILSDEDIDLSLIQKDQDTSRSIVLCDNNGNHSFIGKFGNNSSYKFNNIYRSNISKVSAVFASGYNFQKCNSADLTSNVFKIAKENGIIRGFDTGPIFHLFNKQKRENIYKLCSHIFLTEEELMLLDISDVSYLFENGIEVVIIKRGANGCKVISNHNEKYIVSGLQVPVVDTTAAGDCFDAGFIVGLMKGLSLESCAILANCVGAAKVKKLGGGYNVPTLNEVLEITKEFNIQLEQYNIFL